MITQNCNLIALAVYDNEQFGEEVALVYSPISGYYLTMPTKFFHKFETKNDTLFVTEMKNAYFIPSGEVAKKLRERPKEE